MTFDRMLFDVALEPAIGSRFQPTGFPDLGHAEFDRPDGTRCLLVESAQSMANHLEGCAWDDATQQPDDVVAGLAYVRVVDDDDEFLTASRTEAHRLASAFVKSSTLDGTSMVDVIRERLNLRTDKPVDHRHIAHEIFRLDPFCLIHGVFFADSKWPGQPKVARVLTGFIEATDVHRAESGGVKRDHVRHSIEESSSGATEGYGSVPFARTEWTAGQITASFNLDLAQIRSFGLDEVATSLLESIALWEIRSLLDHGLRLRTACDLVAVDPSISDRTGAPLPSLDELSTRVANGIAGLEVGKVLTVRWDGGKKKAR